jgi:hypothetical protein
VTAITNYSSSSPLFFGRRVIDVQSPKRRPPTTALSKKLHSLPSSVRRIIQPRGWRVLVATAAEKRLSIRRRNSIDDFWFRLSECHRDVLSPTHNTNWEETLSIQFGRQGGGYIPTWRRAQMRFVSTAFVMIAMVLMLLALTLLTTTSGP